MNELEHIKRDPVSRRAFLTRMGAAGLGLAAISLLDGCGGGGSSNHNTSNLPKEIKNLPGSSANTKVLNYALTLEILEADLYRQALNIASGKAASTPLAASPSGYTLAIGSGGLDDFNTRAGFAYLRDFAFVEAAHRDFLITVLNSLGASKVSPNAAGYQFPAGTDASTLKGILTAILPLEETGVRAYLGAVPYVTDYQKQGGVAQTAVSIYSTEARHSSAINYILGKDPGPSFMVGDNRVTPTYPHENTFEYFLTPAQVFAAVTPLFKSAKPV